jgi:hypothetical protein
MAAASRRARYPFENMTAPCAIEKFDGVEDVSLYSVFSLMMLRTTD